MEQFLALLSVLCQNALKLESPLLCVPQVVLTNLRVDIPRYSWSPEMYTLSCAQARLLLPVAEAHVANMMPDMSRCSFTSSCRFFNLAALCLSQGEHADGPKLL